MAIITLTTDFGLKDGNVGVMKGIIWRFAPQVQIADISHLIAPQNIPEAALILARSAAFFPAGSIHVVVVDPGVGTARRPLAAQLGQQFFVGPDNGIITMLLANVERDGGVTAFIHLDRPEYWLAEVSHVFHGRDIFAPVAGRLAAGVPLGSLGTAIDDPLRLALPQPVRTPEGWRVQLAAGGVRGQQPRIRVDDLAQVVGAFMALGRVSTPDLLSECEVNPLVATPRGLVALDVLARLGSPRPPGWPDRPLHKLRNLLRP